MILILLAMIIEIILQLKVLIRFFPKLKPNPKQNSQYIVTLQGKGNHILMLNTQHNFISAIVIQDVNHYCWDKVVLGVNAGFQVSKIIKELLTVNALFQESKIIKELLYFSQK